MLESSSGCITPLRSPSNSSGYSFVKFAKALPVVSCHQVSRVCKGFKVSRDQDASSLPSGSRYSPRVYACRIARGGRRHCHADFFAVNPLCSRPAKQPAGHSARTISNRLPWRIQLRRKLLAICPPVQCRWYKPSGNIISATGITGSRTGPFPHMLPFFDQGAVYNTINRNQIDPDVSTTTQTFWTNEATTRTAAFTRLPILICPSSTPNPYDSTLQVNTALITFRSTSGTAATFVANGTPVHRRWAGNPLEIWVVPVMRASLLGRLYRSPHAR